MFGNLSEEAQAELNGLYTDSDGAPEEESIESSADEIIEEPSIEENPSEEADEVNDEVEDSEDEETQTPESDIEYIKAGGKKIKVDFADRETTKRVYAQAAGMRQFQAERDEYKGKYTDLKSEHAELRQTMDYLESIKDNHEDVFEAVTGTSLEDIKNKWREEENLVGSMSEAEKAMYLSNKDHQRRIAQVAKKEKDLQTKLEQYESDVKKVAEETQNSMVRPFFFQYNFDGELGDATVESRMNRTLWREAETELGQFDSVTPDMVKETMQRISNQIRQGFKIQANKSVKKAVGNAKKITKAKAQDKAIKPKKQNIRETINEKIAQNDFHSLLNEMDLSKI